jgi:hypothetical protein
MSTEAQKMSEEGDVEVQKVHREAEASAIAKANGNSYTHDYLRGTIKLTYDSRYSLFRLH